MQTPIEKAISELKEKRNDSTLESEYIRGLNDCIVLLNSLISYERQHLRDVAEKAIYHGFEIKHCVSKEKRSKYVNDYLNQNHPL